MSNLIDIFKKMENERWSGEVQIEASEGVATVVIQKGKFFYAHRPLDRAIEKISTISWVKAIPPELVSSIRGWDELVRVLMKENKENTDRLVTYLRTDRFELFFRCFFWTNVELKSVEYKLDQNQLDSLNFYPLMSLGKVTQEAQSRKIEWPRIQKQIGSSKRVFVSRVSSNETGPIVSVSADEIDRALSDFETTSGRTTGLQVGPYSVQEAELIRLCDGSHNVQDLVRLSDDGEFLTLRRLLDLWDRGLISPKEEDPDILDEPESENIQFVTELKASVLLLLVCFSLLLPLMLAQEFAPTPSVHIPEALSQSLEVYRSRFGRYPITLQELENENVITGKMDYSAYRYELVNLDEFVLEMKR